MKLGKIFAFILAVIAVTSLVACTKENPPETPETTEEPVKYFELLTDGKTDVKFIRPEKASASITKVLSEVYKEITTTYPTAGFRVKGDNVSKSEKDKEIIVGKTRREGSEEFNEAIPENCFVIEITETEIRIDGYTDTNTNLGLKYFLENYIKEDSDGNIKIPTGKFVSEPFDASVQAQIEETPTMSAKSTEFFDVKAIDGKKVMQGGCTDGKYLYAFMVNSGDSQTAYVHKIDIATRETVKRSEAFATDHSNDGTYVSKTNEIYICHNAPNRTKITIIDADTLEYKKTITIKFQIFSIAYREDIDSFVVGISGGQNFTVLSRETMEVNKDILPNKDRFIVKSTGYTTQGVCCDDKYIYFVQYKQNVVMVYDWAGKFITRINLDIEGCEPENISVVGDKFYIQCNNSSWTGGIIYETEIVKD